MADQRAEKWFDRFVSQPLQSIPNTNMESNEPSAQKREKKPRSLSFYVFLAAALYIVINAHTSDEDLDRLARVTLLETRTLES